MKLQVGRSRLIFDLCQGNAVSIAIGGWNEGMMAAPGKYYVKLKDRKGFVKIALTEGYDHSIYYGNRL